MRRSPLQHPLAVLRTKLGMGQKEFGEKVGRHWRTIQSIELGKLPLSEKLAERICDETGVSFKWLMEGDPEAPIIDERGRPWKPELFFDAQGKRLLPGSMLGRHYPTDLLNVALAQLCAALVAAAESKNVRAYGWRLSNGIQKAVDDLPSYADLAQEFNSIMVDHYKDSEAGREAMLAYALKRLRQWKEPKKKRLKLK